MIKLIKKLFGITTPITKDNRPEQWIGKYAGNSHQRRVARRKAESDQNKVDQRDFSDYPTLINRRQS